MITLRAARQSSFRLARSASASVVRTELDTSGLPHAESSSAPFRRHLSSTAIRCDEPSGSEADETVGGVKLSKKDKERSKYGPNPRLKRQALSNAKKLSEALRSERQTSKSTSTASSLAPRAQGGPTPMSESSVPSDSTSAFWTDLLSTSSSTSNNTTSQDPSSSSSTTSAPTIHDLLAKRPDRDPSAFEPWNPRYARLYKRLYNNIFSAFVISQMRSFAKELEIPLGGRTRSNKGLIVKRVMRSWGWVEPSAKPVERPAEQRVFDLPAPELFLFLRDNDLVQSFAQGDDPIELSVVPFSQAPKSPFYTSSSEDEGRMVLLATGRDEQLNKLNVALGERNRSIKTVTFSAEEVHGLQAPVGLLQVVSNAAGAYVEPLANNSYRATSMLEEDGEAAKQLLRLAAFRTDILSSTRPLNAILPVPVHFLASAPAPKLALYPFASSLTEPLQWDQAAKTHARSLLRLKRVGQWAAKPALRELDHRQEMIQNGKIKALITESGPKEGPDALQDLIAGLSQRQNETGVGEQHKLKVTFGNLLFPIPPKDGTIRIWDSPLPGQWPIQTVQNWLTGQEGGRPLFAPTLTPETIQFPITGSPRTVRRLQYRSIPGTSEGKSQETKFVSFTYTPSQAVSNPDVAGKESNWQDELGDILDKMEKEIQLEEKLGEDGQVVDTQQPSQDGTAALSEDVTTAVESASEVQDVSVQEGTAASTVPHTSIVEEPAAESPEANIIQSEVKVEVEIKAELGIMREIDLSCPDRPCDARITSTSTSELSADRIPAEIIAIFQAHTQGRPGLPPSHVAIDGQQYELEVNESAEITEEEKDGLTRKTVRSSDEGVNGHGQAVVYAEIETPSEPNEAFYQELATITRDLGPDASALKNGANLFTSLKAWD